MKQANCLQAVRPRRFQHHQPHLIFRHVGHAGERPALPYLIYKLAIVSFFWISLSFSWADYTSKKAEGIRWKYVIYMTHWGICSIAITILLEFLILAWLYLRPATNHKVLTLSWGLTCQTYTAALFISLLYWTILYGGDGLTYFNFFVHASQGIFAIIDQLVSNRPWLASHWWVSYPLPVTYVLFNIIYWAAKGTNEKGEPYVYPPLNWGENPGMAVGLVAGALLLLPVLHFFFCLLTYLRKLLVRSLCGVHSTGFSDSSAKGGAI